jgi:PAS domain S-box-containing protein
MSIEKTVLIVDDSPEDRETYRRFLLADDRYRYTILEEEYGEDGLEVCKLVQPDAILLDFQLPDIDGIEFLYELKTHLGKAQIPVVMLTGRGDEVVAVQAMKSGAADYLVKGKTTSESLRLAIRNILERDRLRQQLEQSEARFRTSIENLLDCFGIYKSLRDKSGKITDFIVEYVNAAACANNRMTAEAQIGKKLCEILPSHRENGLFDEYCRVVETGKPLIKEALIYSDIYPDRYLTRAFDIHATKLGDGFVVAWRDMTSRKQAEERLRLLESVVVHANDAVIITAIAPLAEPGPRIVYVNQAFTDLTGYTCEEVIGRSPRFLQGEKTDKVALKRIRDALQAKKPVQEELINYGKDGSEFWVEISITPIADAAGQYTHFVAIQRNIGDRKRAEVALREGEERLRLAFAAARMGSWDWNILTGSITWSDNMEAMFGYAPREFDGSYAMFVSRLHPEDRDRVLEEIDRAVKTGADYDIEFRVVFPDGTVRWAQSKGQVFYDRTGKPIRMAGVDLDISDRKQSEAESARMLELAQQARVEAEAANRTKDEFVAMVSHDLRSPLNAILGWAKLLRTRQVGAETTVRALEAIERNAQSQAKLLEDLLDVSRMIRGTLELHKSQINLVFLVEESVETIFPSANAKGIHLEFGLDFTSRTDNSKVKIQKSKVESQAAISDSLVLISGDRDRLQQVLGNLLSNAIKFTPEGGRIEVRLSLEGSRGEFTPHPAYAQIQVIDTGKGISPEFLPHVFDRFRQAEIANKQGGLGLGLAIARHIVELHGGKIHAASLGVGQGATFTIRLPLMPPK